MEKFIQKNIIKIQQFFVVFFVKEIKVCEVRDLLFCYQLLIYREENVGMGGVVQRIVLQICLLVSRVYCLYNKELFYNILVCFRSFFIVYMLNVKLIILVFYYVFIFFVFQIFKLEMLRNKKIILEEIVYFFWLKI